MYCTCVLVKLCEQNLKLAAKQINLNTMQLKGQILKTHTQNILKAHSDQTLSFLFTIMLSEYSTVWLKIN